MRYSILYDIAVLETTKVPILTFYIYIQLFQLDCTVKINNWLIENMTMQSTIASQTNNAAILTQRGLQGVVRQQLWRYDSAMEEITS